MTRKKSNVKALALAVTCAILAGGYSGLNPVYAADKLYKDGGDVTTTTTTTTEITELEVGGVTIGGSGNISGASITLSGASTFSGATTFSDTATFGGQSTFNAGILANTISEATTGSGVTVGGVKFSSNNIDASGTITTSKLVLSNGTYNISDVGEAIDTNSAGLKALNDTVGDDTKGLVKKVADNATAIATKAEQTALEAANGKITALEGKTTNISYDSTNEITTVDGVKFKAGAVSGVKSINDKIKISDDGSTVTFNKGTSPDQVEISAAGIKVGTGSTYIKGDAIYTGDADYNNAKAGMKSDGSLKAAGGAFKVDTAGKVTTTGDIEGADITAKGNLSVTGTSTFTNGINTDTISEKTLGAGVTVNGNKITTDNRFNDVELKGGNVKATDITANGALNGGTLGVTGAATLGNTLEVTGKTTLKDELQVDKKVTFGTVAGSQTVINEGDITADGSVTAKGGLSAANGNFTVEGTTGNTAVGGTLGVTGDISTDGSVTAKGGLSAANNAFKVDGTNGDISTDGNLVVKQKITGQSLKIGTTGDEFTVDALGNVVAKGQLTAKSATIGTVGITDTGVVTGVSKLTTANLEVTGVLNISGDIAAKNISGDSLTVTGAIKGASLDVTGAVTGATINGATITTNSFNGATIGATTFNGVTLTTDGDVSGRNMTASGTIKGNEITDGAGASMNAGTVTGTKITDGVATMTGGNLTGVNSITASGNITSTSGTIKGVTLTDGVATMNGGKVTAQNGVEVNANNYLDSSGLKTSNIDASKATIGNITVDGATITSNTGTGLTIEGVNINNTALGNVTSIDGVSVGAVTGGNGLQFGGNAVVGATNKPFSSTGYEVDGEGNVTGKSFKVNGSNYLDSNGLTAGAATIGGVNKLDNTGIDTSGKLHVGGQATFGDSTGIHTTINGGTITSTDGTDSTTIGPNKIKTKTLEADTIILNDHMQDGAGNKIEIGADGHLNVAGNNFKIDKIGQLTNEYSGTDAAGKTTKTTLKTSVDGIKANYTNAVNGNNNLLAIDKDGVALGVTDATNQKLGGFAANRDNASLSYGDNNSIVVDAKTIKSALGTGVTRVMTSSATEKSIVDKVGIAKRSLKADEIVDEVAGMTVKTNSDGTLFTNGTTNTIINGSAITSTKATGDTGVLNGSNLTLTNGAKSTALTAGGATFTGADGRSDATGVKNKTIIDGGIITTDTLNVQRIELGDKLVDGNGTPLGGNLSMDEYGNIKAAGGKFTVAGTNQTNPGALHNEVGGKTFLDTTETGASMKFDNTAATDGVKSEVSVEANKATVAAGDKASFVANTDNGGTATITGGTQTVTTTKDGTVFKNSAHKDPFGGGIVTETTINGNEITTGKITTDQLVIKGNGSGAAAGAGSGSIALGGNGSITSNIIAGTKEATFKTDETGTFTEAKDGANVTTNTVNAQGNTNVVTDGTNTSTATQTATSIGGVVTNGTVTMKQELTADGLKLEQTGYDEVNIAKGDVTVKNNRNTANPNQEVHLSDLGSLNNLDGELAARDEYQDNKTAVGAINAEAGIRREEVARLDNRIDDVNNRVDKVGAMAAAIASLKSIGYDPQAPSEFSIGLGQYKGETGVAMGFFHYPNKNFMINVSLSTAGGETMGGIGATWRFGHKSPQKLLEEQREAQAKKELAAAEKYQAAAKLAKEAQERAEYAAKLARQAQVSADNAKAAADATQAKHFQ